MPPKNKPARRHHVVSKFYLKGFADVNDRIFRLPLGGSESHPQSIKDATVQKHFYSVEIEGHEPDSFEKLLSTVEAKTAPALKRVLNEKVWPLTDDDKYLLASWIALQFLRDEARRTSGEEIYRSIAKLEVGTFTTQQVRERLGLGPDTTDDEIEGLRARMLASADTFKVDRHLHLSNIVDMFEGSINLVFFRQPWVLATFQRKALGTSDTPLVLIPDPMNREMGLGTGLGTAMQLFIPLSRRVGLCMGGLGDKAEDGFLPGTTAIAKQLNSYTLHNARKAVFHHPHDAPFAGMRIPEPRTEEMRIPHKQINNLIAGFARQQGRLPEDP